MKKSPKLVTTEVALRIMWLGPVNKAGEARMQIDIMRERLDTKSYFILPEVAKDLESTNYRKLGLKNNFIFSLEDDIVVGYRVAPKDKSQVERKTSVNSIDIEVTDNGQKRILAAPPDFDESVVDTIKRKLPKDVDAIKALSIGEQVANHTIEEISLRKGSRVFKFTAMV